MSISIKTIDYIKTKDVEIDGHLFKMRPMSSAEALEVSELSREMREMQNSGHAKPEVIIDVVKKLESIFFGLWNDEEGVREAMAGLNIDNCYEIYAQVMENRANG